MIEQMWAFVAKDDEGNEGLCAALVGDSWMPLVASDQSRVNELIPLAQEMAGAGDRVIKLVKFFFREEIREIK